MRQKWHRKVRTFIQDERGSQVLEFILVFPLVWLLIVFAFDQFSILYNKQKALAAAYEAGRIAAVQPNFGLASYYAKERGEAELREGVGVADHDIQIRIKGGGWKKGNHIQANATMAFYLLASGEKVELTESYYMMIENAEEKK